MNLNQDLPKKGKEVPWRDMAGEPPSLLLEESIGGIVKSSAFGVNLQHRKVE
jgi:hypothetical protein